MSGIILNWDDSAFFYYIHKGYGNDVKNRQDAIACCKGVIDQYKDTKVTDFIMCVNARLASFPSSTIENYGDSYNRKMQNGQSVDFSDTWASSYNKLFNEWEIDYFEIWIEQLNTMSIKPWISIRMNDAHETLAQTSFLAPDFYYGNPQLRRVTHHKNPSYFDGLFDYGKKEIRDRFLCFIDEALARYDAGGLELDWMREAYCFKLGMEYEGITILTDFMKEVKTIVEKYEKIRGHKISISVRVPSGIETCFYLGFDVAEWARCKLVNNVTLSPRWSTTDTDMPIELWKKLLMPYEVTLAAGIEILIRQNREAPYTYNCKETVYANAAASYSAGADKFYLFNFMSMPDLFGIDPQNQALKTLYTDLRDILNVCSNLNDVIFCDRRHFVTFKDLCAPWEKSRYYVPAICTSEKTEPEMFRIRTGKAAKNSYVYIHIGIECKEGRINNEDISIYLNSKHVNNIILTEEPDYYNKSQRYIYEVPSSDMLYDINSVEVWSETKEFTITHMEIMILRKEIRL